MVTLDQPSFRALASPTRIKILKALSARNHTLSELGQLTGKSAPTVREHLDGLAHAHLIERKDTGHKWKYYELTPKGRSLFDKEHTFGIDLAVFLLAGIGLATSIYYYAISAASSAAPALAYRESDTFMQETASALAATDPTGASATLFIILTILFSILLILLILRRVFPLKKRAFK